MSSFKFTNPTSIVDSHHKVLAAWASYRSQLLHPPRLITLDHHTDTSRPFRRQIGEAYGKSLSEEEFKKTQEIYLNGIRYSEPKTVEEGIEKLNNDEHIVAAIKTNIISSAFVVAHNAQKTDLQIYKEHRIVCHSVEEKVGERGEQRLDYDSVLESFFLDSALAAFNSILSQAQESNLLSEPYILDIDLDYFNTFKSVAPDDGGTIRNLVKNAGLLTIATEPEYVKSCAVDKDLTSEYLLGELKKLISSDGETFGSKKVTVEELRDKD